MPRINSQELQKRRREFQEQAGLAFDQMLGSDGQNGLVTFAEREERACELGDGLTRRLLENHLEADETSDPGSHCNCPLCGLGIDGDGPEKAQSREVRTRRGKIQYERASRRCSRCRRIFFPPG